jgi:hypothetical protein
MQTSEPTSPEQVPLDHHRLTPQTLHGQLSHHHQLLPPDMHQLRLPDLLVVDPFWSVSQLVATLRDVRHHSHWPASHQQQNTSS